MGTRTKRLRTLRYHLRRRREGVLLADALEQIADKVAYAAERVDELFEADLDEVRLAMLAHGPRYGARDAGDKCAPDI